MLKLMGQDHHHHHPHIYYLHGASSSRSSMYTRFVFLAADAYFNDSMNEVCSLCPRLTLLLAGYRTNWGGGTWGEGRRHAEFNELSWPQLLLPLTVVIQQTWSSTLISSSHKWMVCRNVYGGQ